MNNALRSYNNEVFRKFIHISSLAIPLIYFYIDYTSFIICVSAITLFTFVINSFYNKYFSKLRYINTALSFVLRPYEPNGIWGASYLILGFLIITLLYNKNIVIISMLITSLSDSVAAIVGIKYGIVRFNNNKSLEGFYFFFITSYLLLFFIFSSLSIFKIIVISFLISITELLTPTKYDNFTIPIVSSFLLYLFTI